jgi:hypothetical protein
MAGNANSGMKPSLARMRLAARLRRQGKTLHEIGMRLGVTRQAVQLLLRAHDRRKGRLTVKQILAWADDHHRRHGRWPHALRGPHPPHQRTDLAGRPCGPAQRLPWPAGGLDPGPAPGPTPRHPQPQPLAAVDRRGHPELGRRLPRAGRMLAGSRLGTDPRCPT